MQELFLDAAHFAAVNKLFQHSGELRQRSKALFALMNRQSEKLQHLLQQAHQIKAVFPAQDAGREPNLE